MWPHSVITLEHRESLQRGGEADRRKAWVPCRREWAAMIHRGHDSHARRHLVVEESPDLLSQYWCDHIIESVIRSVVRCVKATRQVPFQCASHSDEFTIRFNNDDHRGIAEHFGLQGFGRSNKLRSGDA